MNIKLPISHSVAKSTRSVKLESDYQRLSALSREQIFNDLGTGTEGLSADRAAELLAQHGRNTINSDRPKPWYLFLLRAVRDEFILVLLLLGVVSIFLGDRLGASIIFILALISTMMRFVQDYSAYRSSQKLKTMIHTTVDVRRDGKLLKVNIEQVVPGDVVELGSGSIIPADLYVIENKDLFLSQSMFTGESIPVEKRAGTVDSTRESTALDNICLMGCNVVSGSGVGVVVKTGRDSYLGAIAHTVEDTGEKTNFEKGLAAVTRLLVRYMIVVVSLVFLINGFFKHDWLQALLFSISVAVGITPGMLPMIVNATLSKGAQFLARKKTIVKNISSIQNLGAIDILCTDKTGTLTEDNIVLQRYINIDGQDDKHVLDYGYLNSYFGTGIKNLIDKAIISYGQENRVTEDVAQYKKVDEIPFDYERKRMSVVIEDTKGTHRLITKGALEEVLKVCTKALDDGREVPINPAIEEKITGHANLLNRDGMHVIALAEKREKASVHAYAVGDESAMTFIGYMAFLDPPKPDVAEAVKELYAAGIDIKILTGDAPLVAQHICGTVGLRSTDTLTGKDIEAMDDAQLLAAAERTAIFARLAPMQKDRVVAALRAGGHVVGYMGDGVNDAPALRHADVGISVDTATDIAKESSDIILLEKSLMVVRDGIYEGRRIYGNIMKYMKMALSSNFGNVFSVLIASLLLPFLPLIPIQILIQNLIYDFTQLSIPWDNVDPEFLARPKRWDTRSLANFMNVMGVTSSVYDVATFGVLWFVFSFNTIGGQQFFQTGWFIEGLISQTLIVYFIRTSKIPFIQSTPNFRVLITTGLGIAAAIAVPWLFASLSPLHTGLKEFNFAHMPAEYYLFLAAILAAYAMTIEIVKRFYIKAYKHWL